MNLTKYFYSALVAGLLLAGSGPQAAPEFNTVKTPTTEQVATMELLNSQISKVQDDLGRFFEDLRDHSCEDDAGGEKIFCNFYKIQENGVSVIPLTATVETFYGQRQRFILNEAATVRWQEGKPVSFRFDTRRGALGKGAVLIKRLSGNSIVDSKLEESAKAPLNLVVNELLSSGKGQFVNFRFPSEEEVRDRKEEIDVDGRKQEINVVFVRDPNQKIRIMRAYLEKLKLLEHRLDWMARSKDARKAATIERLLRQ
ncbi:MAG: hypothetical protein RIF32_18685 [Leptospirales bacterium]|jgi:hypothetical protein